MRDWGPPVADAVRSYRLVINAAPFVDAVSHCLCMVQYVL